MTDNDRNLRVGQEALTGSMPARPIDEERAMRLRLAALGGDNEAYAATIGAILLDNTGPTRVTGIVNSIGLLVADILEISIRLAGEDGVREIYRAKLLESLRTTEQEHE